MNKKLFYVWLLALVWVLAVSVSFYGISNLVISSVVIATVVVILMPIIVLFMKYSHILTGAQFNGEL